MNDDLKLTLFILAAIVGVALLSLLYRRRQSAKAAKLKEYSERFKQRQLRPHYSAFKSRYGCEVPPPLRALQEDHASRRAADFDVHLPSSTDPYFVAWFEPMDDEHMSIIWPGTEGLYPFANDGSGNSYLIDPRESDPTVSFYDHETGEQEPLSVRLSEFLAAKRTK